MKVIYIIKQSLGHAANGLQNSGPLEEEVRIDRAQDKYITTRNQWL